MLTEHDVEKKLASLGPDHPNRVQLEILRRLIRIDQALHAKDDVLVKTAAVSVFGSEPQEIAATVPVTVDLQPVQEGPPLTGVETKPPEPTVAPAPERFKSKGRRR